MKRERLRADGLCLNCKGPRTPQKGLHGQTGVLAHLFAQEVARDPFCSSSCCRIWHGTAEQTPLGRPPRVTKYEGDSRTEYRMKHRVPCEGGCGTLVEGKGRTNRKGQNPNRPFLCLSCSHKRQKAA